MHHLGMELHAVELSLKVRHRRLRRVGGVGQAHKPLRQCFYRVAMAHPHRRTVVDIGEQIRRVIHFEGRLAVFGLTRGSLNNSTELLHHQLHPVANPQHGNAQIPDAGIAQGRMFGIHGTGATAEDDSLRSYASQLLRRSAVAEHHRKHLGLAHAPSNQLRILGAEIKNDDGRLTLSVGRGLGHRSWEVSLADERQSLNVKKRFSPSGPHQRRVRLRSNRAVPIRIDHAP